MKQMERKDRIKEEKIKEVVVQMNDTTLTFNIPQSLGNFTLGQFLDMLLLDQGRDINGQPFDHPLSPTRKAILLMSIVCQKTLAEIEELHPDVFDKVLAEINKSMEAGIMHKEVEDMINADGQIKFSIGGEEWFFHPDYTTVPIGLIGQLEDYLMRPFIFTRNGKEYKCDRDDFGNFHSVLAMCCRKEGEFGKEFHWMFNADLVTEREMMFLNEMEMNDIHSVMMYWVQKKKPSKISFLCSMGQSNLLEMGRMMTKLTAGLESGTDTGQKKEVTPETTSGGTTGSSLPKKESLDQA